MAYDDLLDKESINSQFLIVLKPVRKATTWTLSSGVIYKSDFDFGTVINVSINGTDLTEGAASTGLGSGEWFWDKTSMELFVRQTNGLNPTGEFVIVTYEIYVATFDQHFPRQPDTTESVLNRIVYWEPVVSKSPMLKATLTQSTLGFLPTQSTSIMLINAEHIFERHIDVAASGGGSSFNQREITVYHQLNDPAKKENIRKVMNGLMSNINYSQGTITMRVTDRIDRFNKEYRNPLDTFYNTTDFPNVDPNMIGRAIRYVYGRVDGVKCVNIDFNSDEPTTSNNRKWAVRVDSGKLHTASATATGTPTGTITDVDNATGFAVGDQFKATGSKFATITAIDYGTNTITHTSIAALSAGNTLDRATISSVYLIQGSKVFQPLFDRDYTEGTEGNDTLAITFIAGMEANVGAETLSPTDIIIASCYGKTNDVTFPGATAFGTNDTNLGNLTSPIAIMVDLLKNRLGLPDSELDSSGLTTLEASISDESIGFALPERVSDNFPTFKDLLARFSISNLLRIFLNNSLEWTATQIGVLPSIPDKTIEEDEIINNSIRYSFDYLDVLSDVTVEYGFQELSNNNREETKKLTSSSNTAKFLHNINKQKTFKTFLIDDAKAQTLANRLAFIYGEREGSVKFLTKNRFFDTLISDTVKLKRSQMPGFEFDKDILRERNLDILDTSRGLSGVTLIGNDQKGIEDNSGSF